MRKKKKKKRHFFCREQSWLQSQKWILLKIDIFWPSTFHLVDGIILVQYYLMWKNQQLRNISQHFVIWNNTLFHIFNLFSEATYIIIPHFMSGVSNALEAFVL